MTPFHRSLSLAAALAALPLLAGCALWPGSADDGGDPAGSTTAGGNDTAAAPRTNDTGAIAEAPPPPPQQQADTQQPADTQQADTQQPATQQQPDFPPVPGTPQALADHLAANAIEEPPIGNHGRAVSNASPEAQAWFDQGLRWLYGFNHSAAAACFARAAQASPDCAMAWWGIAQAFAVDINNMHVTADEALAAEVAAHEAARLAGTTDLTPVEAGLVEAAQIRAVTPAPIPEERTPLDEKYQAAIEGLYQKHPGDPDLGFLHAEALMLLQPWEYWTPDGEPVGRSEDIVAVIEGILDEYPKHPGACHLYIHAVESSNDPGRAEAAADRLGKQVPGSGHLVHMPSHLYIHVGRYDDATDVNLRASELDERYLGQYEPSNFEAGMPYRVYFLHNIHFAAFGAMMEGQRALALREIERMEEETPDALVRDFAALFDGISGSRLHVLVRFGLWDEILAVPPYAEFRKASTTMRHYARAVALANTGRTGEAREELAAFDASAAATPEDWLIAFNPCHEIYDLARKVAEAEILWREGRPEEAIPLLEQATVIEHNLTYTEPPPWMIPVRHTLGAIELASGHPAAAEQTYREDLERNPENAWGLLGLHQALMAQGRTVAARQMQPRMDRAWRRADIDPPASCYCGVDLATAAEAAGAGVEAKAGAEAGAGEDG